MQIKGGPVEVVVACLLILGLLIGGLWVLHGTFGGWKSLGRWWGGMALILGLLAALWFGLRALGVNLSDDTSDPDDPYLDTIHGR